MGVLVAGANEFFSTVSQIPIQTKIMGGTVSNPHEFPYQVQLRNNDGTHFCGGVIINTLFILTAAHCCQDSKITSTRVVAGEHDLKKDDDVEQLREISKMIIHEEYNRTGTKENDLALLMLSEPMIINDSVQRISIAPRNLIPKGVITTGWGTGLNGQSSDILKKVNLEFVSNKDCQEAFRRANYTNVIIRPTMICAGGRGKDACEGDSGGPLVCLNGTTTVLCGITSFGAKCDQGLLPGVYTNVAQYRDWIRISIQNLRRNYTTTTNTTCVSPKFPFLVQLKYLNKYFCGGTIFSTKFILTAAHCVVNRRVENITVIADEYDLKTGYCAGQIIRTVSRILYHDAYNNKTREHDIAMLVLSQPLAFNNVTNKINIAPKDSVPNGIAVAPGWGIHGNSKVMKKQLLPIVPYEQCSANFSIDHITIFSTMVCAGEFGNDPCEVYSEGGPLICFERTTQQKVLCGITSFGNGCGRDGFPGVYTNLAHYHDWIEGIHNILRFKHKCQMSFFYCHKKRSCIPRAFLCDGDNDCGDSEDEKSCLSDSQPQCNMEEFRCENGRCIQPNLICNTHNDCGDWTDEDKCPPLNSSFCSHNKFRCSDGRCLDLESRCDNNTDCDTGEDEKGCFNVATKLFEVGRPKDYNITSSAIIPQQHCKPNEFSCANRKCINLNFRCDLEDDCGDNTDETHCQ